MGAAKDRPDRVAYTDHLLTDEGQELQRIDRCR
jgi:hypothetical protein